MRLKERYRRLTLWNKISLWGSIASIVSIAIAIVLWRVPISAPIAIDWSAALADLQLLEEKAKGDALMSRTFWLAREPGATISLGECPSDKCMTFKLGRLRLEDRQIIQEVILIGDGFGVKHRPDTKYLVAVDNAIRVKGAALSLSLSGGPTVLEFGLQKGAEFEMFTPHADLKVSIVDLRTDSLRIRLDVKPPSGFSLN
ncbi:MAG TPA: hypothetical protein VIM71_12770 [Lacunisphaera sp.]